MNISDKDIFTLKQENERLDRQLVKYEKFKFFLTDWIYHRATGEFTISDIDRDFNLTTVDEKTIRGRCIKSLMIDETICSAGKRHGYFKIKNTDLKKMDFTIDNVQSVPIWLPFGIHKLIKIFPGNIIQINGEKNSGKTALMLNIIKNNMHMFKVVYFNSEMGGAELRERLLLNNDVGHTDNWDFEPYERASDFHHVLFPEKDTINIIDFLEQHEDFWMMGKHMRDIHDNLGESVGVVCVQLNKGSEQGLGGSRTEEKPRLIINLSPGKLKIKMAKNWATSENPNGKFINFKLVNGCKFISQGGWQEEK